MPSEDQRLTTRHEGAAVSIMHDVGKALETAREAAEHGNYTDASRLVADARERLYFAEIELRKAAQAAKRSAP